MKVPGRAWLQFEAIPEGSGTRLVQTALFEPIGLGGPLYWNAALSHPPDHVLGDGVPDSRPRRERGKIMKTFDHSSELWLPTPLEEVFPFFADARNLEELTPDWLSFTVLTPEPIPMAVGTTIDYRLAWRGIPLGWRSEIAAWEPPHRFVDDSSAVPTGCGTTSTPIRGERRRHQRHRPCRVRRMGRGSCGQPGRPPGYRKDLRLPQPAAC